MKSQISKHTKPSKFVGNREHVNILTVYSHSKIGQMKLARGGRFKVEGKTIKLHHRSSETICYQLWKHNSAVKKFGLCEICRHEKSSLDSRIIQAQENKKK